VVFTAELLSADHESALVELDEMDRHIKAAAKHVSEASARDEKPDEWIYHGIRRSLEERSEAGPSWQRSALLHALSFVEESGKADTLDNIRQLLNPQGH